MSITACHGDLLGQDTDAIVNTVNCVGVMGKGIALQFKRKWPENFKAYEYACSAGKVKVGEMFVHDLGGLTGSKPRFIINFPTKQHWRGKSQIAFIETGLAGLCRTIKDLGINSISLPPLGCGNGGLDWSEVEPLIRSVLDKNIPEVEVRLFGPGAAPKAKDIQVRTEKKPLTLSQAILIKLISIYRELDYALSRIEVQKLMYFMQESGEPLKLNFLKDRYGPYADNLRHVLNAMEGHYICGVGDHDASEAEISLTPDALPEAESLLSGYPVTNERIRNVATLIDGFENPFGMELLATVHWAITRNRHILKFNDIVTYIHTWEDDHPEWTKRKKIIMGEPDIEVALNRLTECSWMPARS